jgi:hypothetical protein
VSKIYFCLLLRTAEFLRISLNSELSLMTPRKWVRSSRTDWSASVLEAELKSDPAYLPEGVSVSAGGLWPR